MAERVNIKAVPNQKPKPTPKQLRQEALFEETLTGLANKFYSKRFKEITFKAHKATIKDFKATSGKFPWEWSRDDFEEHCAYLFRVRGNAVSTQRGKQLDIKKYMDFLIASKYKNIIQRELGITLDQICFPGENMIVHKVENDNETGRRDLTAAELTEYFSNMDDEIKRRFNSAHKGFVPAQRDKALFGVLSDFGLRSREVIQLNVEDIGPNPDHPEFGNYGYIDVYFGKATAGSNPKYRRVWTLDQAAADNLKWYVEEVRPKFIGRHTKDIRALFYSERGTRLSSRSIQIACKEYLSLFGMNPVGVVPHSFRHSYTTVNQEVDDVSANVMQRQLGHAMLSTTQGYTHFSDPSIRKMLNHAIDSKREKNRRRRRDED